MTLVIFSERIDRTLQKITQNKFSRKKNHKFLNFSVIKNNVINSNKNGIL